MNGALNIHPKVAGATISGSLGILVVWLLGQAHVTVGTTVAAAIVAVLAAVGGWLAPIADAEKAKLDATPAAK